MRGFVISLFLLIALACVASIDAQRGCSNGFRCLQSFERVPGRYGRSTDGRRYGISFERVPGRYGRSTDGRRYGLSFERVPGRYGRSTDGRRYGRSFERVPGRYGRSTEEQTKEKYEWEVDMGMDTTITQKAISNLEEGEVVIMTVGRELNKLGLRPSAVYLNVKTGVMAISGRRGPCFLTSTSETNVTVENDLMSWNGTEISITNSLNLTGTAEPQDAPEELVKTNPGLRRVCGGRRPRVINATPIESDGEAGDVDTEIIKTLGYNTEISIIIRSRAQKKEDRAQKKENRKEKGRRGGQRNGNGGKEMRKGPRGGNKGQGNKGGSQ